MNKENYELHVQMLDNGIVLSEPAFNVLECEKYAENGYASDTAMHTFIGKNMWENIFEFCNKTCANNVKITISIEKE